MQEQEEQDSQIPGLAKGASATEAFLSGQKIFCEGQHRLRGEVWRYSEMSPAGKVKVALRRRC